MHSSTLGLHAETGPVGWGSALDGEGSRESQGGHWTYLQCFNGHFTPIQVLKRHRTEQPRRFVRASDLTISQRACIALPALAGQSTCWGVFNEMPNKRPKASHGCLLICASLPPTCQSADGLAPATKQKPRVRERCPRSGDIHGGAESMVYTRTGVAWGHQRRKRSVSAS